MYISLKSNCPVDEYDRSKHTFVGVFHESLFGLVEALLVGLVESNALKKTLDETWSILLP